MLYAAPVLAPCKARQSSSVVSFAIRMFTVSARNMAPRCPQVHIEGLKGTEYLDSLDGRKRQPEEGDVLQFNGEVDRIYTGVPGNLQATARFATAHKVPPLHPRTSIPALQATWCHGRIVTPAGCGRRGKACDRDPSGQVRGCSGLVRGFAMQCSEASPGICVCDHVSSLRPRDDFHCRNPWIDKAKATTDFGDDEYMVRDVLHTWPLPYSEHKVMPCRVARFLGMRFRIPSASTRRVPECRRWCAWSLPLRHPDPSH